MSNERRGRARRTLAGVAVLGVVAATFLVGLDTAGATSPVGDTTVYGVQTFNGAVGPQWSDPSVTPLTRVAYPAGVPNKVLGVHGNETVYLTLHNLPTHSQITINYDFLALMTWDGESTDFGPDTSRCRWARRRRTWPPSSTRPSPSAATVRSRSRSTRRPPCPLAAPPSRPTPTAVPAASVTVPTA